MADETTRVLFAAPPREQAGAEFPILRAGEFVKGGRRIAVSDADLDTAVANFDRWRSAGQAVPIDYDHSFASGGSSKAAGWLSSIRRDGDRLLGRVDWTDPARAALERDEYRYFSPEFTPSHKNESGQDEGFTIVSGGLTNRPFLRGTTRVAFSADTPGVVELDAAVEELLGEKMSVDENQNRMDPEAFTVEIEGEQRTFSTAEIVELVEKASGGDELRSENETLSARVEGVESDLRAERFGVCFAQAQREGRVDAKPETRKKWAERFDALGYEAAREILFEMPPETIPVGQRGQSGDRELEVEPAAPAGVDPVAFALDRRANELMADNDTLDYLAAVAQAEEERAR